LYEVVKHIVWLLFKEELNSLWKAKSLSYTCSISQMYYMI